MITKEVAELIQNKNVSMYELAEKTLNEKLSLTEDETKIVSDLDTHFKEIGKRGFDEKHEISSFMERVINEEIYNAPDELLDLLFDRNTITENDDFVSVKEPKNTLVAYEAAKGGNVDRSFLDISVLRPVWKNFQVETDISYADLAKNGWKTIALYTDYATAALKNKMFKVIFDMIDAGITSGAANYITESSTALTEASADAAALYIQDVAGYGVGTFVARSKYIQQMSKFKTFTSPEIINEVHRTGKAGVYDGIALTPISGTKKLGDGTDLMVDKRVFGIADKIGSLNMKGDINVYQDANNDKEKFHLSFKNFTFGVAFNKDTLEKVCKIAIA